MKLKNIVILFVILALGTFFRLYNVNWDANFHLHPDERFLTMIGLKETLPAHVLDYLNPAASPLSPSFLGFGFFVYGVLPLTINTLLALLLHTQLYDQYTLQGRILSGIFDVFTIYVVYLMALLLQKKFHLPEKTKYFSAFFYALSVLPIQLSHFFTVDIFLSFFVSVSICSLLYCVFYKKLWMATLSGVGLGLAIACKINALAVIPLEIFLLFIPFFKERKIQKELPLFLIVFLLSCYISVRFADPYLFASRNVFDIHISPSFLQSIHNLTSYANPQSLYPPNIQWINKLPVVFSLFNIAFFGIGLGLFAYLVWGIVFLIKTKRLILISLVAWVILFFLYQSTQYVKTMRYFIFLYPFFALFAGVGFAAFLKKKPYILFILVSILWIVVWPISFLSIYTKPHTRVTASIWINNTIPMGSTILGEYWDDPLPLSNDKGFTIDLLHVFDQESKEKWQIMQQQLTAGDYLVLSSNRGWGSIMESKNLYPKTSAWYRDLFNGKLSYKKVSVFTSFPSLSYLGIPITFSDTIAEEAFTVYDHPVVYVFKNESR
ncbi:MAG TPA: phospholipid carrier-dependent glycosyltransferase [Candidatus Eisenbacteria bacterium]|nr:phospholipid carrier-dependent glycosyltransferase [Candidatus Eisenbacteria bacterium]